MGSTRNYIPFNYIEVFSLLITINQHLPVIQTLFLWTSVVWVSTKLMGPAKRLEYLVARTAVLYQRQKRLEEEGSGSFWSPTPSQVWHIYNIFHISINNWYNVDLSHPPHSFPLQTLVSWSLLCSSVKPDLSRKYLPSYSQPSKADYTKCRSVLITDQTQQVIE